jgi:hypothetical protein
VVKKHNVVWVAVFQRNITACIFGGLFEDGGGGMFLQKNIHTKSFGVCLEE